MSIVKLKWYFAALAALAVVSGVGVGLRGEDGPRRGGGIFDFGPDPRPGSATTKPAPATKPVTPALFPGAERRLAPVLASAVQIVADDFVTDIHHNGKPVGAENRKLQAEIFGAQVERVALNLKPGDWVVFNVVNNRLRWKGAYYFAAAAVNVDGMVVYSSQTRTGDWSACDDLAQAARFIAERDHLKDRKPQAIAQAWDRGDREMLRFCPDFEGEAIWGAPESRSTWVKFVVPEGK